MQVKYLSPETSAKHRGQVTISHCWSMLAASNTTMEYFGVSRIWISELVYRL